MPASTCCCSASAGHCLHFSRHKSAELPNSSGQLHKLQTAAFAASFSAVIVFIFPFFHFNHFAAALINVDEVEKVNHIVVFFADVPNFL
jgi:hypothetical protein